MKNKLQNILFLVFLLSTISFTLSAQTVGLVLSGGGSKGLAHIGVIRALEENNIPIDYVVGTSIGAIVGGLYAIGLTPDEMEALFRDEKFVNYYKGQVPEGQYYFFKDVSDDASAFGLGLSKNDSVISLVLPTNLVATQPMDFGILEYFTQYSAGANNDFDCLFVPFRCVGSDIYNNREVVFRDGDLGSSIRASMTFPFYFKPIEIDSVLFFDGGIYNNFPIDVMRNEFNPDIMIGVSVTSYSNKPNPDDLLLQIENMIMGEKKEYDVPPEEGVTLNIDFENVSLLDFHRVDEFTTHGYESCLKIIDSLKVRILRNEDSLQLSEERKIYRERLPILEFDKVYFDGINKSQQKYLENSFKVKSEKLTIRQLESEYYKLISDYQIETATPLARYNDTTGFFDVIFNVRKKKRADVLFGAGFSNGNSNQAFLGFNYKILNRVSLLLKSNVYYGRLYSSLHLSARLDIPTRVPLALEMAGNVNRFDYFKGSTRLFSLDFKPPYIINFDNNTRLDLIAPIQRFSVMKLGYSTGYQSYNYFQVSNFLQNDTSDFTTFVYNSVHYSIVRDNLNYKQYANKGALNLFSFRYVKGTESNIPGSTTALDDDYKQDMSWMQFQMLSDSYNRVSKHFTLGVYAEILLTNKPLFRNYTSSLLSAPVFSPIPHSKTLFLNNYRAHSYAAVGLKPIIVFSDRFNLRLEVYAFLPYEKILRSEPYDRIYQPYFSESFSYLHFMGSASLVYITPFGPIALSANYYDTESLRTFFMVHFGYILFNKRGLDY